MKKHINLLYILIFTLFTLCMFNVKKVKAITQDADGNWYWGYKSQLNSSYYASLANITDKVLFEDELHKIISTGARKITYGSSGTREALKYLDEDPNDTSKVLCIYTGNSYDKNADSNTWNQEHTWAKSHGFSSSSKRAYCDINHLRVTQNAINSKRSSYGFAEVSGANTVGGGFFEPRDCVKGDVARIMMYMDVRYNGDSSSDGVNLTLVNGTTSTSSGNGQFGDLETLKKWHVEDPVDDLERRRNDRAYEKQGNRNPFIDHPEYANIIYGTNYDGGSTPTPELTCSVTFKCGSAIFNYQDNTLYPIGSLVKTPYAIPYLSGYSFIGWYKDASLSTEWNFSEDIITADLVLYAKFEEVFDGYKVTYNANGGSFGYVDNNSYDENALVNRPTVEPTKTGYQFVGWYKDAALSTEWNFLTDKITSHLTLYAKYEEKEATFDEIFSTSSIYSSLEFGYKNNNSIGEVLEDFSFKFDTFNGAGAIGGTTEQTFDLKDYINYDTNIFTLTAHKNDNANYYINSSGIRLYPGSKNGSSIEIKILGERTISLVEVNTLNKDRLSITISSDKKTAILQNVFDATSGNRVDITDFTVYYQEGVLTESSNELVSDTLKLHYYLEFKLNDYLKYVNTSSNIIFKLSNQEVEYNTYYLNDKVYLDFAINVKDYQEEYGLTVSYNNISLIPSYTNVADMANYYVNNMQNHQNIKPYLDILNDIIE